MQKQESNKKLCLDSVREEEHLQFIGLMFAYVSVWEFINFQLLSSFELTTLFFIENLLDHWATASITSLLKHDSFIVEYC